MPAELMGADGNPEVRFRVRVRVRVRAWVTAT